MRLRNKIVAAVLSAVLAFAFVGCADPAAPDAPGGLRYAAGVLTWDAVAGADGYVVSVTKDGVETAGGETAETSYAIDLPAGSYVALVSARAGGQTSAAAQLSFTVEEPAAAEALPAPTNIIYDGGWLTWDGNPDAENGFETTVADAAGETVIEETVTEAALFVGTLPEGTYTASVRAAAVVNRFEASRTTEKTFTVTADNTTAPATPMPAAGNVRYSAELDAVVWDTTAGNNGYTAEITADGVRRLYYDGLEERADLSSLPLGTYTASVTVSGDGQLTADSAPVTIEFTIESLGALAAPAGVAIENGFLTWTGVPFVRDTRVTVADYATGEPVEAAPKFSADGALYLTDLGVPDGLYTVGVSFLSNRYDTDESAPSEADVMIETAAEFSAAEIAAFSGESPYGEHGAVSLVTEGGVQYAEVRPTADGWGRVASPSFALDFDRNPICFMEVGYVFGGYHLQLQTTDLNFYIMRDTNRLGNANGDLAAATGLTGRISDVRLRIGVNSSTTEAANDARVRYSKLNVCYISEIVPPDPATLDQVRNLRVDNGCVVWDDPENDEYVNAYGVTVTDSADEVVYSGDTATAAYEAFGLADGIYTVSVTAKNSLFPDVITPSAPAEMQVRVSAAVRYTAEQIDTYEGDFVSMAQGAPNDVQASFDGSVAIFNSTNVSAWGYIGPETGVTVDMDRDPIAVIRTAGAEGGYFIKAQFTGSGGAIDVVGDTSVQYEGDRILSIRLNEIVNGSLSGVKTDYKLLLGCLAAVDSDYRTVCRILLYGIDIVYVDEYVYTPPPETPEPLSAPTGFALDGAVLSAQPSPGNSMYTPVYDVTLTGGDVHVTLEDQPQPRIDLGAYDLEANVEYTVSVRAVGDGVYFSDSPAAEQKVRFATITEITDFTSVDITARENGGSIRVVSQGADGFTYRITDGNWGLLALPVPVSGTLSAAARLYIEYGDVTEGVMVAGRYYNGATGAGYTYNLGGDHPISSGMTEVYANLDAARIDGGNLYLGIGMGGGSGERNVTVRSVRIVEWQLV